MRNKGPNDYVTQFCDQFARIKLWFGDLSKYSWNNILILVWELNICLYFCFIYFICSLSKHLWTVCGIVTWYFKNCVSFIFVSVWSVKLAFSLTNTPMRQKREIYLYIFLVSFSLYIITILWINMPSVMPTHLLWQNCSCRSKVVCAFGFFSSYTS